MPDLPNLEANQDHKQYKTQYQQAKNQTFAQPPQPTQEQRNRHKPIAAQPKRTAANRPQINSQAHRPQTNRVPFYLRLETQVDFKSQFPIQTTTRYQIYYGCKKAGILFFCFLLKHYKEQLQHP